MHPTQQSRPQRQSAANLPPLTGLLLTSKRPPRPLWADLLRMVVLSAVAVALATLLVWGWAEQVIGAHRGRILDSDSTAIHGALAICLVSLFFPAFLASPRRIDAGYRHRGLIPVFIAGSFMLAVLMMLSTLLWPEIIGPLLPTSLYFAWGTSPIMLAIAFFYSWTMSMLSTAFGYLLGRWSHAKWNNRFTGFLIAMVVMLLMIVSLPLLDMPTAQAPLALLILVAAWVVFTGLMVLIVGLGQATRKPPLPPRGLPR